MPLSRGDWRISSRPASSVAVVEMDGGDGGNDHVGHRASLPARVSTSAGGFRHTALSARPGRPSVRSAIEAVDVVRVVVRPRPCAVERDHLDAPQRVRRRVLDLVEDRQRLVDPLRRRARPARRGSRPSSPNTATGQPLPESYSLPADVGRAVAAGERGEDRPAQPAGHQRAVDEQRRDGLATVTRRSAGVELGDESLRRDRPVGVLDELADLVPVERRRRRGERRPSPDHRRTAGRRSARDRQRRARAGRQAVPRTRNRARSS